MRCWKAFVGSFEGRCCANKLFSIHARDSGSDQWHIPIHTTPSRIGTILKSENRRSIFVKQDVIMQIPLAR